MLAFFLHILLCSAVKEWMFKRCDQNPFCERQREYAKNPINEFTVGKINHKNQTTVTGEIYKKLELDELKGAVGAPNGHVVLPFVIKIVNDNIVHFLVDEANRQLILEDEVLQKRLNSERYDPSGLVIHNINEPKNTKVNSFKTGVEILFGDNNKVHFSYETLMLTVYHQGKPQIVVNKQHMFNIEHLRRRLKGERGKEWVDRFDKYSDRRVRGPESVAVDTYFVGYDNLYGIPEHADSLSLKHTKGLEPYRLFNVDIFEYEAESRMPMYGSIPLITAHKPDHASAVFWLNAADTYIDIDTSLNEGSSAHWMSETGKMDMYLIVGDTPKDVLKNYGLLTGTSQLPQLFAVGYHQCRWNYMDQNELLMVNEKMDINKFPYDVIWLDIEWTNNRKYFEWNDVAFEDPEQMMATLDETKRKLVVLNDPHIKVDKQYPVYNELEEAGVLVKDTNGNGNYFGYCWPEKSVWIDTFNPLLQPLWDKFHKLGTKLGGYAHNLHLWSDMSEPSVFSGSETTAYKGLIHHGGWQHRDVHNVYGHTVFNASFQSLLNRYNKTQRPFVLTRSFFAGSQKLGPTWTGDNQAEFEYLQSATATILTLGVSGYPFAGADVGGFFRNPSDELLTRWYQAGSFYPFFRAHAHVESRYREPYLLPEELQDAVRNAIELRYALLPYYYTLFYDASVELQPIMRPMYYEYPQLTGTIKKIDDQFFIGSGLVAKPVVYEGAEEVRVILPKNDVFYHYFSGTKVDNRKGDVVQKVDIHTIPLFVRGGSVIFRKDRKRRSSQLMKNDPYTILVALDKNGHANGHLYVDDGISLDTSDHLLVDVNVKDGKISAKVTHSSTSDFQNLKIERIIVFGGKTPSSAEVNNVKLDILKEPSYYIIRNPAVKIGEDWEVITHK